MSEWQKFSPSKHNQKAVQAALLDPTTLSVADLAHAVSIAYSYRWCPSYRKALLTLMPAIEEALNRVDKNRQSDGEIMSIELLDQLDVLTRVALVYRKHMQNPVLVFVAASVARLHAEHSACPLHTYFYLLMTEVMAVCLLDCKKHKISAPTNNDWRDLREKMSIVSSQEEIDRHHLPRVLYNMALTSLAVRRSVSTDAWTPADDILIRCYAKWATEKVPHGDWSTFVKAWCVRAEVFLLTS